MSGATLAGARGILACLGRLDSLLERAVGAAELVYGAEAAADPFRGLYLTPADVERLFERAPGALLLGDDGELPAVGDARLESIAAAYALTQFEVDTLLVALAPEIDLRYERLYGYLQDDVTRKRPTVDLVLNLLCTSAEDKIARRLDFGPGGRLIRNGLVRVIHEATRERPPLLAHALAVDDQVVRWLLGDGSLAVRLSKFSALRREPQSDIFLGDTLTGGLEALFRERARLRLLVHGPPGAPRRHVAQAVARSLGRAVFEVDLERAPAGDELAEALHSVGFVCRTQQPVLLLDGIDSLRTPDRGRDAEMLLAQLVDLDEPIVLSTETPWAAGASALDDLVEIALPRPSFALRRHWWESALAEAGGAPPDEELVALASRFELGPDGIASAVGSAAGRARWLSVSRVDGDGGRRTLFGAAREQARRDPGPLAVRIEPSFTWDDIVLPDDELAQLHEICARVRHRHVVRDAWGFGERLALGGGLSVLFSGPSGTGKTMAAAVIAADLELDLYRIDLSQVLDKYVGETEKRLETVFNAGEASGAVLFFDEADAVFGKRSETKDAHDRYANIEVAYLLQRIEHYGGIAVLATNLRSNLDAAFMRRLSFAVEFPAPDAELRRRIWEKVWPSGLVLDADVDLDFMAERFTLPGGFIRNIAVGAAFLAAADGGPIAMRHVVQATRREYQKLGNRIVSSEFEPYEELLS